MSLDRVQKFKKLFLVVVSVALLAVGAVYFALSKVNTKEAYADPTYAGTLKITKAYYESFESAYLLPINQVYAGDDILYVLRITNISTNPESRFGGTIQIDDELSPDVMSDVHVEDIIINTTWLTQSQIDGACSVNNSYVLHCSLAADLFSANELYPNLTDSTDGDAIEIRIKAKATVHGTSDSYQLHNRAYVYSGDDLDDDGPDCKTLADAKQISRCHSEDVVFCVVMPEIEIDKQVNKSGRVVCYYYANPENATKGGSLSNVYRDSNTNKLVFPNGQDQYLSVKDITELTGSYESNCMNNDGGTQNYTIDQAYAEWETIKFGNEAEFNYWAKSVSALQSQTGSACATDPTVWTTDSNGNKQLTACGLAAEPAAKNSFVTNKTSQVSHVSEATNGYVDDQSVRAGERIEYTLTIRNYGSAVTKGGEAEGVYIYDQLDPLVFDNTDIYVQPLTGGVTCSVEQSKITCYVNRPIAPYDLSTLISPTKYTYYEANLLYNRLDDAERESDWVQPARVELSAYCDSHTLAECNEAVEQLARNNFIVQKMTEYKPESVLPGLEDCLDTLCEDYDYSGYFMNGQYGLGNLPVNDQIQIRITAIPRTTGEIKNIAYVAGGGDLLCPNDGTNSYCHSDWVSTFVSAPELHINKELRNGTDADTGTSIVRGTEAKYIIKVTNEGTADTKGMIVIHDVIPEYLEVNRTTLALTFDDSTYNYNVGFCEFRGTTGRELYCRAYDTIEGGLYHRSGVWTIEFNVRVTEDVDIDQEHNKVVNYAYVYGGEDPVCSNEEIMLTIQQALYAGDINPYNRCYDYLGHSIVSPKLYVSKGVDKSPTNSGEKFNYWVTVENKGDYPTTADTTVLDHLPDNITINTNTLSSACTYEEGASSITCTVGAGLKAGSKETFKYSATSTNLSGQVVNTVTIFNPDDGDCNNDASALNTSRCHASVSTSALSPLLKIETSASALEVYNGGQIAYLTTVKNIGNAQTTAESVVTIQMPTELRLLGVRASKGTCRIDLHYFECTLPAGIQAGETVYISTLAQATAVTDVDTILYSEVYGGGDPDCNEVTDLNATTSRVLGAKVFADDTVPTDTAGDSTTSDTDTTTSSDEEIPISSDATTPSVTSDGQTVTPAEPDTTTNKRCHSSAGIRIIDRPAWATDIDDNGTGTPNAGIMSTMQALGTVSMLGVASYMVLKSRKDFAS